MRSKHCQCLLSLLLLTACAAPGEPSLRKAPDKIQGPLISECKNVASDVRVDVYNTSDYLTTWESAAYEGTVQGFSEGLGSAAIAEAVRKAMLNPTTVTSHIFNELPGSQEPFCRAFHFSAAKVKSVIGSVLAALGNPILLANNRLGIYRTDFVFRQHPAARWKDSYIITVGSEAPERAIVRVLRLVFISRDGSNYNQGISVGYNETWVLTRIADGLN